MWLKEILEILGFHLRYCAACGGILRSWSLLLLEVEIGVLGVPYSLAVRAAVSMFLQLFVVNKSGGLIYNQVGRRKS